MTKCINCLTHKQSERTHAQKCFRGSLYGDATRGHAARCINERYLKHNTGCRVECKETRDWAVKKSFSGTALVAANRRIQYSSFI